MNDNDKRVCGECRYHAPQHNDQGQTVDWWCENIDSDYCAMSTDYNDTCDEWEERE